MGDKAAGFLVPLSGLINFVKGDFVSGPRLPFNNLYHSRALHRA